MRSPMELVFIYMDGCPACEATKPALRVFQSKHPLIKVNYIDLLTTKWPEGSWSPEATPTLLATFMGRKPVGYVGTMSVEEIEKFVRIAAPKLGLPVPL